LRQAKGYGYANAEWKTPNTLQTKFRVGSLTKQFTATAIMQLRERGLLSLQDSICKYLQPCVEAWKPVTLHHLLSHTSGIAGYREMPDPKTRTIPPWTAHQIAAQFQNAPLDFAPGARWQYSDWSYCLLGLVIENVTGKSYAQVLREQIFEPLGMHDTGYDRAQTILEQRATSKPEVLALITHWTPGRFDDFEFGFEPPVLQSLQTFDSPLGEHDIQSGTWDTQGGTLNNVSAGIADIVLPGQIRASTDYRYKGRLLNQYGASGNLVDLVFSYGSAEDYLEAVFAPTGQAYLNLTMEGTRYRLATGTHTVPRNVAFDVEVIRKARPRQ
jgi:CubicO group peptidase (beta-lactamase class C family)